MAKEKGVLYITNRKQRAITVKACRCIKLYRLQRYFRQEDPDSVYAACMNLFNMGLVAYDSHSEVVKGF